MMMDEASEARLARHVQRRQQRFVRGVWDCCAWMAHWVWTRSGKKIGEDWLGRPLSNREALRILRDGGGLGKMLHEEMTRVGWREVSAPWQNGDVCLIEGYNCKRELEMTVGVYRKGRVVTVAESGAFRLVLPEFIRRAYRWE